jgi:hypothetical protein
LIPHCGRTLPPWLAEGVTDFTVNRTLDLAEFSVILASMNHQLQFIGRIDQFLADTGLAETTFGRMACNDSTFVADLREGRSPSLRTLERVETFMNDYAAPRPKRSRPAAHV